MQIKTNSGVWTDKSKGRPRPCPGIEAFQGQHCPATRVPPLQKWVATYMLSWAAFISPQSSPPTQEGFLGGAQRRQRRQEPDGGGYLSLWAPAGTTVQLLTRETQSFTSKSYLPQFLFPIIYVLLSTKSYRPDWRTEDTVWREQVRLQPD